MTTRPQPRLAFPKKGRLKEDFALLLENAGFCFEKRNNRLDYGVTFDTIKETKAFETLTQRPLDALANLEEGLIDGIITGRDSFEEHIAKNEETKAVITATFNFSSCSLQIAARPEASLKTPEDLRGLSIATSYPASLSKWLKRVGVEPETVRIIERDGGVEDYIRLGLADAICDIVDTGSSLKANGLIPFFKLFDSTAVFVERDKGCETKEKQEMLCLFKNRLLETEVRRVAMRHKALPVMA